LAAFSPASTLEFLYLSPEITNMGLKKPDHELLEKISALFKPADTRIVIIPHENPDGDAIGSAVGLGNILANKGHGVTIISPNEYPPYYYWLESKPRILLYSSKKNEVKKAIEESNIIICVDFNDIKRTGKLEKLVTGFTCPKILVDHHPDSQKFCDFLVTDVSYSSTSELIFDLATEIGWSEYIDKPAAESLFVGVMTDTGSFSHNISDPNTFRVVSELLIFGINAEYIHEKVYNNFSSHRMRLLGYCLSQKLEILPEFNTAFISLTKDELKSFNFAPGDSEGFVNYPLSINGVVYRKRGSHKNIVQVKGFVSCKPFFGSPFCRRRSFECSGWRIEVKPCQIN
jgi:phosphoesterase RecJ-like protein